MSQLDRSMGLVGNAALKYPVIAATTANITLSAEQTIDGIACVADDRVLVKNQTTGSENGIWVVATGSWNRANDFDGSYDCTTGTMVRCVSGTTNANSVWKLDTTGTITIGTTSLTFTAASVGFDAQGMADFIHAATSKATPVDADELGIWDSVSGLLNKLTLANLKALVSASWNAFTATSATTATTVTYLTSGPSGPTTVTGATATISAAVTSVICNRAGTITLTMSNSPVDLLGRLLFIKTYQAQTVVSASSDIIPITGGAAGTAILSATAGKWAILQRAGATWEIIASN